MTKIFIWCILLLISFVEIASVEHEARYYVKLPNKKVQCLLCPRRCVLKNKQRGYCTVRENRGGKLYSLVYGKPVSIAIDPIEKKPVFHMLPGSKTFSFATVGCNLRCIHCQNWQISQVILPEQVNVEYISPEKIVDITIKTGCKSISYTYTEPTVFFEYMVDIAKLARQKGLKNIWVTSGYINPEPLRELCRYLDIARVDLKGFTREFYRRLALGEIDIVLNTLKILKEEKVFIEVVNLIIPEYNDDFKIIKEMCLWIKENLGEQTPIFFSRFFPHHKLTSLPPTPVETLEKARDIALSVGLKFVYLGNVPGHEGENTYCPRCKLLLIRRIGYTTHIINFRDGRCKSCDTKIPGIWN